MTYIFRNHSIEYLFNSDCQFSGYCDISNIPQADEYIWFYQIPIEFDNNSLVEKILSYKGMVNILSSKIGETNRLAICTLEPIKCVIDVSGDTRLYQAVDDFNSYVRDLATTKRNITVLEISDFTSHYSTEDLFDPRYYFSAQIPYNPKLRTAFKKWISKKRREIALKRKKCLILDLDNTLWAGVVGEEGTSGIQIGGAYPGNAYLLWQQGIKSLQSHGVILAICSKNNESDIEEVWRTRNDMPLEASDFSAMRINWQDKASNIQSLSKELNIGLDSMVFVDDNPSERELVRGMLPDVTVPDFPEHAYDLIDFYRTLVEEYFSVYNLVEEDFSKTKQYSENRQRVEAKKEFQTFDEYLQWLKTELTISEMTPSSQLRVAQMIQKTNQFNLTSHRHTEQEIQQLQKNGAQIFTLSVKDRLGDLGITGCLILKKNSIDSFLLSCRILGRGIERAFFSSILNMLKEKGVTFLDADYIPTLKNTQTKNFYEQMGAELISTSPKGDKHYRLNLNKKHRIEKKHFTIQWI